MELVKGCFRSAAVVWLSLLFLIGVGGWWLTRNVDTVADAAASASGIKDAVASERTARCERARREARRLWDDAVDSGRLDQQQDRIDEAEADARQLCEGL